MWLTWHVKLCVVAVVVVVVVVAAEFVCLLTISSRCEGKFVVELMLSSVLWIVTTTTGLPDSSKSSVDERWSLSDCTHAACHAGHSG